jgi:hypothetical protein
LKFQLIHPAEVRSWWSFVRPKVFHVLKKCHEHQIPEDVYAALVANRAVLHILHTDKPSGVAITELCGDLDNRFLNVWLLHFVRAVDENRQDILDWLDKQAEIAGVKQIRFQSPRAWSSLLRGAFKEKSVIYEREVK